MIITDDLLQYLENLEAGEKKVLLSGICIINGGNICWREAIQYRYIGSDIVYYVPVLCSSYLVFQQSLKWHLK